jgi:fumarate hydratase class II
MKTMPGKLIAPTTAILLGLLVTTYVMATEEPKFKLIEKEGEFELSIYYPLIVAETYVEGSLSEATSANTQCHSLEV